MSGHTITVPCKRYQVSHVVGPSGSTIKAIRAETSTTIDITDGADGHSQIAISGPSVEAVDAARERVERILASAESPDYEGEEGKRLRAEADAHAKEWARLKEMADQQFAEDDKAAGHATMARAKEQADLRVAASSAAAKAILAHRNDGKGDAYLDLHGLRVAEAEEATRARIEQLQAKPEGTDLELIPGAGNHSAGAALLKPAIENILKELQLAYEPITEGSFRVHVLGTKGQRAVAAGDVSHEPKPEEKKEDKKGGCCVVM